MNKFELSDFKSPAKEFAPVYGWCWNGPISQKETLSQINKMRDFGIKAFYILPEPQAFRPGRIPTQMDPNYMTEAYLEQYKFAMDKANEYGLECWLYDEGGWPSGGACGQVMTEYPEYAKRTLSLRKITFKSGDRFQLSDEDAFAGFLNEKILTEEIIFEKDTEVDEYYSERLAWKRPGVPDLPDLTRKEATDAFLRLTHEKYKKYLGDHIGSTLTTIFTDEPEAPILPFRQELCDLYQKEYDESILPYLPALFDPKKRNEDNLIRVRRWYDICSRLFCENFLLRCRNWANKNGMKFTGHLNVEDEPMGCMRGQNYHVLRGLRTMDIPGIDVIWRQIFPGNPYKLSDPTGRLTDLDNVFHAENRFFPRYASSAAAQIGSKFAMTECYGVYGSGMTYDQMRFVAGFQAIRGVTLFNPLMVIYYRRTYLMMGELPAFAEYHACSADLGVFNRYLERLSYICTIGERICDVALYYPVNDYWGGVGAEAVADEFETLGKTMEARGIDFDIVDDDVIAASEDINNGIIRMGNACYRKIILPKSAYIPPETATLLKDFACGGGTVSYSTDGLESEVKLLTASGKIRTMKRHLVNGELICLFNEDIEKKEVKVGICSKKAYFANVTDSKVSALEIKDGVVSITLESGETGAILLTTETIECDIPSEYTDYEELSGFSFRRTNSFVIGEKEFETYDIKENPAPMELGCWAERVGVDFSGSGIYETTFKKPKSGAVLDLGDVRYTCEVFVNGNSLGVKVMAPYRYELPDELLSEENTLEIRVSNTPGNQYQYSKSLDKWGKWQLTGYNDRQLLFDRDTLASGLYGPVRLLF